MLLLVLAALLQAPAVSAPQQAIPAYQYLLVEQDPAIRQLSPMIARATPSAQAAAPGSFDFSSCAEWRGADRFNRCVRATLPDDDRPRLAFALEKQTVSNVTGSVVFYRHTIWCIGPRSIARIQLGGELSDNDAGRIVAALPGCVADALREPAGWGGAHGRNGVRTWRFPLDEARLAGSGPQARGRGSEYAIVEVTDAVTPHQTTGRCALQGRIVFVEAGRRLREGDRVALDAPCQWEGPERVSTMFMQSGLFSGWTARVYVDYSDGQLLYVEAL